MRPPTTKITKNRIPPASATVKLKTTVLQKENTKINPSVPQLYSRVRRVTSITTHHSTLTHNHFKCRLG